MAENPCVVSFLSYRYAPKESLNVLKGENVYSHIIYGIIYVYLNMEDNTFSNIYREHRICLCSSVNNGENRAQILGLFLGHLEWGWEWGSLMQLGRSFGRKHSLLAPAQVLCARRPSVVLHVKPICINN